MCATSLILFAALDLGTLFANKDAWIGKAEFFAVEHAKEGFQFASESRDIVNCLKHDTCTWHGLKVWETKVYFDKGGEEERIARVELSLYNRGDAGDETMDVAALKREIADVARKLDPTAKKWKPEKVTLKNDALQYRVCFDKADPAGEVVWGLSAPREDNRRAVEYLRLTLTPKDEDKSRRKPAAGKPKGAVGKAKIKDNVTKSPNGDVFIDNVPMVDQGQKGYCAAAVSERVLRYYGNRIDEHEIAQQAGSRAAGGTRAGDMIATVREIGVKKRLGFNQIVSTAVSLDELEKEVEQYNKAAKSMKEPEVSVAAHTYGLMVMVSEIYDEMKPKVLKKMRTRDARYRKFLTGVKTQIDKGVPICWGVTLGVFPEPGLNPQSKGGHMRLIIGYNAKTHEILYSDTWGAGHELKRMPEDWAFTITHEAFFLRPL